MQPEHVIWNERCVGALAGNCCLAHLQADSMLMFPLHVIDVPGHSLHRVYSIEHNIIAFGVLVKVIFYFLKKEIGY